ncbi:hypothetical protein P7C73_g656, partial [Tremellales sp. Uapishka_1]
MAAPSSLTQPSLPSSANKTRPKSASISSVHFAPLNHSKSLASIRSADHKPPNPSNLHVSTLPSTRPALEHASSSTTASSYQAQSLTPQPSPRSTHDRRIRSEGHAQTRIAHGRRPSAVMGGYESSTDDGDVSSHVEASGSRTFTKPKPNGTGKPLHGLGITNGRTRSRAKSVVTPNGPQRCRREATQPQRRSREPSRSGISGSASSPLLPPRSEIHLRPPSQERKPSQSAKKYKGKERETRPDGLAASLGLGTSDAALTSDVASALRLINAPSHLTLPPRSSTSHTPTPSRPTSPSDVPEPFLVSAPPALTSSQRDRNDSISSTIAPQHSTWSSPNRKSLEDDFLERRRRANSMSLGHVPFTHHLPNDPPSLSAVEGDSDESVGAEPIAAKKKSRLSHLFQVKRKKGPELVKPITEAESSRGTEKDAETKKRELHRRAQELEQVAAHPESERAGYRVGSHFQAYYNQIYDGLSNPPPVNPLAIIRWRMRSQDATQAKTQWEARFAPPKSPEPSWSGVVHSSPVSMESSDPRHSNDSGRTASTSPSRGRIVEKQQLRMVPKSAGALENWQVTVEDMSAYKSCNGRVNYFIPPKPASSSSAQDIAAGPTRSESSSVGGSMRKDDRASARVTSASTVSLADGSADESLRPTADKNAKQNSLSSVGHTRHGLHVPFERLHHVARKHVIGDESNKEDVDQSATLSSRASRTTAGSGQRHVFRRSHHDLYPPTDDEQSGREFHLRKLFKGPRPASLSLEATPSKPPQQAEMRRLQMALAQEAALREREANDSREKTRENAEAQAKMAQREAEVYADRKQYVDG